MRKAVVVKLTFVAGISGATDSYVVTKIVNSTEFRKGNALTKKEVDSLIARRDWRVEME